MVPQHSSGNPPQSLSPELEQALERAFRSFSAGAPDATAALTEAVRAVGKDARERGLHPEHLLLAFKAIEDRVRDVLAPDWRDVGLRPTLIRAMLEIYYS